MLKKNDDTVTKHIERLKNANESLKETETTDDKKTDNKLEANITVKIEPEHKEILENHFKKQRGLKLSSGIRELIFNYMRENKLI